MTDEISNFIPTKEPTLLPWTEQEGGWILGRLEKAGLGIYAVKEIEELPQKFLNQLLENNIVVDKKVAEEYVKYDPKEHIILYREKYEEYQADVEKLIASYENYMAIVNQHNKIMTSILTGDYDNATPKKEPTENRTEESRFKEAKDGAETEKPKEQLGFFRRLFK